MHPDRFLEILSTHNQETKLSPLSIPLWNSPDQYWISRNIDFKEWSSVDSAPVLWITGPPQCRLHQIASHIMDRLNATTSNTSRSILYFFAGKQSSTHSAIQAFLRQFLLGVPGPRQKEAITEFLRTVVDAVPGKKEWKREPKNRRLAPTTIPELLNSAEDDVLWKAFQNVLEIEQGLELLIVVDDITHEMKEFIRSLLSLVNYLLARQWKVKALLTSLPESKMKPQLPNQVICIEYDAERKGSTVTAQPIQYVKLMKCCIQPIFKLFDLRIHATKRLQVNIKALWSGSGRTSSTANGLAQSVLIFFIFKGNRGVGKAL